MLKLAGESSIGLEKIEQLVYNPGLQDTGDLEAATKTITATSEASGTGNADYSSALTLPKPDDARIEVLRIATRLATTIDSMTAGQLNCRIYVDQQDAAHKLYDINWPSTGSKLDTADVTSGTIFDLLADGSAHTFYFFFWVDAGNAVLNVVQLWEGVGTTSATGNGQEILKVIHSGLALVLGDFRREGTGSFAIMMLSPTGSPAASYNLWESAVGSTSRFTRDAGLVLIADSMAIRGARGTVATDLVYTMYFGVILRSEQ